MQRRFFIQLVVYINFSSISFGKSECGHGNLSVYGNGSFCFACKIYNSIFHIQVVTNNFLSK